MKPLRYSRKVCDENETKPKRNRNENSIDQSQANRFRFIFVSFPSQTFLHFVMIKSPCFKKRSRVLPVQYGYFEYFFSPLL